MAYKGDIIKNAKSGETFEFITTTKDSGGKFLKFNWTVEPGGQVPFEHIHPIQDETFRVMEGEAYIKLNGREQHAKAGESVTVKAGEWHVCWNNSNRPLKAEVEFIPAGITELGFETLCGLATDGKSDAKGHPGLLAISVFADKYRDMIYIKGPPVFIQKAMFWLLARIGRLMGKQATYKKYSGFDS